MSITTYSLTPIPDAVVQRLSYNQPVMVPGWLLGDSSAACPARVWFPSRSPGRIWLVVWKPLYAGGRRIAFPHIADAALVGMPNGRTPPPMPSWATAP